MGAHDLKDLDWPKVSFCLTWKFYWEMLDVVSRPGTCSIYENPSSMDKGFWVLGCPVEAWTFWNWAAWCLKRSPRDCNSSHLKSGWTPRRTETFVIAVGQSFALLSVCHPICLGTGHAFPNLLSSRGSADAEISLHQATSAWVTIGVLLQNWWEMRPSWRKRREFYQSVTFLQQWPQKSLCR